MNSNSTPADNFEPHGKPDKQDQSAKKQSLHTDAVTPGAQPPVETAGTEQGKRHEIAAGLPAVNQTLRFAWGRMGVVKGTQALLSVNQKEGSDSKSGGGQSTSDHRRLRRCVE